MTRTIIEQYVDVQTDIGSPPFLLSPINHYPQSSWSSSSMVIMNDHAFLSSPALYISKTKGTLPRVVIALQFNNFNTWNSELPIQNLRIRVFNCTGCNLIIVGPLGMDCWVHQTVSRAGDSGLKEKQDEVQDQCLPQQAVLSSQQYCGLY